MKKILFICILFSMGSYSVFVPLARAEDYRPSAHLSADKMLEFSLQHLKESVEKTAQKNERLSYENDMLRKSIQDLQVMKETLLMKRAELSGRPNIESPQTKMQLGALDMDFRQKRTQELIPIFQNDIQRLKEEVRIIDGSLSEEGFVSRKKMLLQEREKSSKNLSKAKKELESLEKRNRKPLKQIEELKNIQKKLAREVEGLQYKASKF